jgi:hypothetical protein
MKKNKSFKYELESSKIDENTYLVFDTITITKDGNVSGANVITRQNGVKYFHYNRKAYAVAKVVLCLFGTNKPEKYYHYIDANKSNCAFTNLKWGLIRDPHTYPQRIHFKGITYNHCPSFPGLYVNDKGEVYSARDPRRPWRKVATRELENIPSVAYSGKPISTTVYIHLLVLEAFAQIPYGNTKCIWKDGNRSNPALTNLQIADESQIRINHFIEGRREPNKLKNILDKKYGFNLRPWTKKGRKNKTS